MIHKFKLYMIHYKITVDEMLDILLALSKLKGFYEDLYKKEPSYKVLFTLNKYKNMWDDFYKKEEYEN